MVRSNAKARRQAAGLQQNSRQGGSDGGIDREWRDQEWRDQEWRD
ncbi:hypothetical protein [Rhizobium sp. SSA_523]|nr:hypothetical protein [Rhizobium sp. SSA_523]WKC24894.1 hypothetical protein QTJ18_12845 [Rhizobium sp. SSA_523]